MLAAIENLGRRCGTRRVKLVSNLPYSVAVPVVTNLLLSELVIERMVVTVQWEIAERLLASPGVKEYAALAVLVQSLADVELVRRLPPKVFWPRPLVDSAIVCIRPAPPSALTSAIRAASAPFCATCTCIAARTCAGALASLPKRDLSKSEVDARLAELGLDGTARAEALDLEQHLRLCGVFG